MFHSMKDLVASYTSFSTQLATSLSHIAFLSLTMTDDPAKLHPCSHVFRLCLVFEVTFEGKGLNVGWNPRCIYHVWHPRLETLVKQKLRLLVLKKSSTWEVSTLEGISLHCFMRLIDTETSKFVAVHAIVSSVVIVNWMMDSEFVEAIRLRFEKILYKQFIIGHFDLLEGVSLGGSIEASYSFIPSTMGKAASSSSSSISSNSNSNHNFLISTASSLTHLHTQELPTDLSLGLTIPTTQHVGSSISREQWQPNHLLLNNSQAAEVNDCNDHNSFFVKVYMEGIPIGRKLNILAHEGYYELVKTLEHMFDTTILWGTEMNGVQPERCHVLTYEDEEGDLVMVGDVPWEMFLSTVKRLKITRVDTYGC
ncbi:hypothetical protein VNO77_18181 [Canavalia gladiata]|uniref:Auxin-induced protein n=1 Tax=Canavalia gladiata TaxID=3824 RepID=A0AAN9LNP6_CANGL